MRTLQTAVIQDLLCSAQHKLERSSRSERDQYCAAVVALELELATRQVFDDAVPETTVPIANFREGRYQRQVAMRRVRQAAECRAIEDFTNHLGYIHPAALRAAWELVYTFRPDADAVITLLKHIFFWVHVHDDGEEKTLEQMHEILQRKGCEEEGAIALERAIRRKLGAPTPRYALSVCLRGRHA